MSRSDSRTSRRGRTCRRTTSASGSAAYTGTSFQTYLQDRRLRFAHSLLTATALAVTEVCHAAGFNNLSHFGRVYRRHYGTPPSTVAARL